METAGITHSKAMRNYLAFMGPRLVLMHRALKPTGSLFLHCDPTANSYLRLIMDAIFGRNNFVNEIVWGYRGPGAKKKFGSKHDTLLFYRKFQDFLFNPQYTPMLEATKKLYRHDDNDGKGKYLLVKNKKTGKQYKSYLNKNRGRPVLDWWEDIQSFNTAYSSKERTGYPTQKPLKLLRRIINATTNPGDLVLDPFCGCATTCVAAEQLDRRWIGIDESPMAAKLVVDRLGKEKQTISKTDIRVNCNMSTDEIQRVITQ